MKTYLGPKGYTILKSDLSNSQQIKIRDELTIRPFSLYQVCPANDDKSFPAYRESSNKLYVPHYYGVNNFGLPQSYKISEGKLINLEFNGKLRDYQEPVVNKFIEHCYNVNYGGGLLELFCAWGKTSASLYIISKLKRKTLVIVHKEFLMNQWIERIQQFLPEAKIGKIQGPIIDVDNKDIVLCMLQSLISKEYPQSLFNEFGFTIIDEVHHISSQSFSNSLFKVVTKYMLGLSATMERKDGTSNVFKMFLGDIIYKSKREEERNVIVRAIDYFVDDDEFNKVITDFRGNPQYSTMITKLCEYNHRSEFILKILVDLLNENPNQQIMILAHNKNLLKYLHDAIIHRNIATTGYYIGGMKEKQLKNTELKKVIIATYSMAAEGLDIKTLTTLIMATPKTDIEQSVGRILREKHNNPIVIDIIDSHILFKNQWKKRKSFYKKQNYKIIGCNNIKYTNDINKWKIIFEPKILSIKDENINENMNENFITFKNSTKNRKKNISNKSISYDTEDEYDDNITKDINKFNDEICYLKL
jgi:superfamily II DNA or RNA helicase